MTKPASSNEVDRNYVAFTEQLPELLKTHLGKFALMHQGKIVDFFDSLSDAVRIGKERYGDAAFSVQEVTSQNVNLGFYAYAVQHVPN